MTYELQARQQTTLTPRLQQSVKLLQMSTLDFSREVAEAIANNPFLEEQEEGDGVAADKGHGTVLPDNDMHGQSHEDIIMADTAPDHSPGEHMPETQHIAPDPSESAASYSGD